MAQIMQTMWAALRRIGIVVGILIFFGIGLAGTIYLSLRSSEVRVPDVVGKHYVTGQTTLEEAHLNIRKRAKRLKGDAAPDTILDQSPRAGEIVKVGQTIAVVVADEQSGKNIKEGATEETSPTPDDKPQANSNAPNAAQNDNRNGNENQNRNQRNKNTNRNSNKNANNSNAGNQNANNRNSNANRNTNNSNANRNTNANRNANANANNRNANNRNANANNRNANLNTNRNANTTRNANNANRRPPSNQATPF